MVPLVLTTTATSFCKTQRQLEAASGFQVPGRFEPALARGLPIFRHHSRPTWRRQPMGAVFIQPGFRETTLKPLWILAGCWDHCQIDLETQGRSLHMGHSLNLRVPLLFLGRPGLRLETQPLTSSCLQVQQERAAGAASREPGVAPAKLYKAGQAGSGTRAKLAVAQN